MSKIICEVCGSSYPDTAAQCPICGYVNTAGVQSAETNKDVRKNITKQREKRVRGGRYSKANVRKRNKAAGVVPPKDPSPKSGKSGNRGLIVVAIVLLLAIVAVLAYIAIMFVLPRDRENSDTKPIITTTETVADDTTVQNLSCTGLTLPDKHIKLTAAGQAYLLNVVTTPANTTDQLSYISGNPQVATVTKDGLVEAVSSGKTTIKISCGKTEVTCIVECVLPEETTTPDTTEAAKPNKQEPVLNREDVTFSYAGEKWQLYSGSLGKSQISWRSDNESVVTVNNGLVVAVGPGNARVYAEYNGQETSCIFRCSFSVESDSPTEDEEIQSGVTPDHGAVG